MHTTRGERHLIRNIAAPDGNDLIETIETETNLITRPPTDKLIVDFGQMLIRPDLLTARWGFRAIFVRHVQYGHWCGYTLVNEGLWRTYQHQIRTGDFRPITYAGEAGKYVTWRQRTANGRLTIPAPYDPTTIWVGFDWLHVENGKMDSYIPIRDATIQFGCYIHTILAQDALR